MPYSQIEQLARAPAEGMPDLKDRPQPKAILCAFGCEPVAILGFDKALADVVPSIQ